MSIELTTSTPNNVQEQPRKGKFWTETEITQLKEAITQGTPLETIAATHGRTLVAIDCKLAQLGKARVNAGEAIADVQGELRFTTASYKKICTPKKAREKKVATVPVITAPPPPAPTDEKMMAHIFKRSLADFQSQVNMLGADTNEARAQVIIVLFGLLRQHIDAYEAAVLFSGKP